MSYTTICVMRTFLVLIAWCVAILIPEFQLVVSFVGGNYIYVSVIVCMVGNMNCVKYGVQILHLQTY